MKRAGWAVVAFVVFTLLVVAITQAQDKAMKGTGETTLTGEVVDVSCYLGHGAKGEGHKACAVSCAKAGGALGILTSKGMLYVSLMPDDHKGGPNEKLMAFIAQNVKVEGTVKSGGGVNGIVVKSVAAAK